MRTTETTAKAEINRYIDHGYSLDASVKQVKALHLGRKDAAIDRAAAELKAEGNTGKFTEGQELSSRSICNHDCIFTATVIKRTAKTVTIEQYGREVKRCKVHTDDDGNEFIYPHGRYSMAAIFRA